jgi:hypothetical protein
MGMYGYGTDITTPDERAYRDRFYKTQFRPKIFQTNFYLIMNVKLNPEITDKLYLTEMDTYVHFLALMALRMQKTEYI